jgi:hypothetical protein
MEDMQVIEITLPDRNLSKYSLLDYMKLRALRERSSLPHAIEDSSRLQVEDRVHQE